MSDEREWRDRRSSDPLLIEVHGMLKTYIAHFDDHVEADRVVQKDLADRLKPVEDLNTFLRTAMKIGAGVVALGGVGGVVTWIKFAAAHVHVPVP